MVFPRKKISLILIGFVGLLFISGLVYAYKKGYLVPKASELLGVTKQSYVTSNVYKKLVEKHNANIGLVGYWNFDEGTGNIAKDSSGNGNNGAISGATWVDGKIGKALNFDGVDDYVVINDSPSLDGMKALTIEAWVLSKKWDVGIVVKGGVYVLRGYGKHAFYLWSDGKESGYLTFEGGVTVNQWTHLVATYDSSLSEGNMKLYKDGVLVGTRNFTGTLANNGEPLYISRAFGSASYFQGLIDEVKIYSRALTAEEVKKEYEGR